MKYLLSFTALTLLAGCASVVDGQTQDVTLKTPGAENARCHIENEDMKYVIYTDQTIEIMKSPHDLEVNCLAPGNREKSVMVKREINDLVAGNVVTGVVPGIAYDYFSRGGFEYPEVITVDFTGMKTKSYGLPAHYTEDLNENHINNRVVDMGPNEMITEGNRSQVFTELKKKEGLYGEEISSGTVDVPTTSSYRDIDAIHRQYNPQVNYHPDEETK